MTSVTVTVRVAEDTDIRAYTIVGNPGQGMIPWLVIGGDPDRKSTVGGGYDAVLTTGGWTPEQYVASLDRLIGGLELLRRAVLDGREIDEQIVAAGSGAEVAA